VLVTLDALKNWPENDSFSIARGAVDGRADCTGKAQPFLQTVAGVAPIHWKPPVNSPEDKLLRRDQMASARGNLEQRDEPGAERADQHWRTYGT